MTLRPNHGDRLTALAGAMLDGALNDAERQELAVLIAADPMERARYIDLILVHSMLQKELAGVQEVAAGLREERSKGETGLEEALEEAACHALRPRPASTGAWSWRKRVVAGLVAAALILVSVLVLPPLLHRTTPPAPVVATIEFSNEASGSTPAGASWQRGTQLAPGLVSLSSGRACLRLQNGATIVLEGAVQAELVSTREMRLISGRMLLNAPAAARGFVVHTPEMKVVDLGTELGFIVTDGQSETHVFQGSAEASAGSLKHVLVAGQAVRATRAGELVLISVADGAFADLFGKPQAQIRDTYVCGGISRDQVFSDDKRLVVKQDTPDRTRYAYLNFDLSKIRKPIRSARLVLTVGAMYKGAPAGPEGNVTHQALLVASSSWATDRLTWDTQPPVGAVVAQWKPHRGQRVEIDLTGVARAAQARTNTFGLRIAATGIAATGIAATGITATGQDVDAVWVDYVSTRGAWVDRPRLIVDVGQ